MVGKQTWEKWIYNTYLSHHDKGGEGSLDLPVTYDKAIENWDKVGSQQGPWANEAKSMSKAKSWYNLKDKRLLWSSKSS